jgi:hypothetical protein
MLFATTFWSFPREFSSLTPAAIRNGPAGATIRSTSDESTSVRVFRYNHWCLSTRHQDSINELE